MEEKQRSVRRQRELEAELAHQEGSGGEAYTYSPTWYKQVTEGREAYAICIQSHVVQAGNRGDGGINIVPRGTSR